MKSKSLLDPDHRVNIRLIRWEGKMKTLKEIREEKGFSIKDLATRANVSPASISKIESGLPVGNEIKQKLAKALKLPLSEIEFFEVHRY